ncbi:hypothetical protein [Streptomyces djakartensis]|uniref:hypothetical protein n=1 Tax=Streptomyces djakartensis TaxID=68193 RepID=UPI0034DFDFF1
MVTYVAVLGVPRHEVEALARLLGVHRRWIDTPKGSRGPGRIGAITKAALILNNTW